MDAAIVSDIHLGTDACQDRKFIGFLESILGGTLKVKKLILNGDVFDSYDFRRLTKGHWKILSLLRKLSKHIEVVWICGNHDGPAEAISHLLGISVMDQYVLRTGAKKVLCLHGHQFDDFLDDHPILTWIGDTIYWLLQKIDRSHYVARMAKHSSKHWLRCADLVEERAIKRARKEGCDIAICGHVHHAVVHDRYCNSGCWTENPCTWLAVSHGKIELREWTHEYHGKEKHQEFATVRCEELEAL